MNRAPGLHADDVKSEEMTGPPASTQQHGHHWDHTATTTGTEEQEAAQLKHTTHKLPASIHRSPAGAPNPSYSLSEQIRDSF